MKLRHLLSAILFTLAALAVQAQSVDWNRLMRMIDNGEYKSAYVKAEALYGKATLPANRLAAAYCMSRAARAYQEDAYDSSMARYRRLLPSLPPLERAICYTMMEMYDSALVYADTLKATPVSAIELYTSRTGSGVNLTPTAYDVVVVRMMENGTLAPQQSVEWQRRLCEFHAADGDDIRILHDDRLLDLVEAQPNVSVDSALVQSYINRYRGTKSQYYTRFYFRMAALLNGRGQFDAAVSYCDSAIAFAPKSEGAMQCHNLRGLITDPSIQMTTGCLEAYPGQPSLQRVAHRNVQHLYYRLVRYFPDYQSKYRDRLRSAEALYSGEWDIEDAGGHQVASSYVALPPMKAGHYWLLVSPTADFRKQGFAAYETWCTDVSLMKESAGGSGYLLDSRSGLPIVGQEVKLGNTYLRSDGKRDTTVLATTKTDADGCYDFGNKRKDSYGVLLIERDGVTLAGDWRRNDGGADTSWRHQVQVRTDRPIYKPGDTLHVAALLFTTDRSDAMALGATPLTLTLRDPKWQVVAEDSIVTDEYGIASTWFILPKDRMAGRYCVEVRCYQELKTACIVPVEEYKQPKFMVELGGENEEQNMENEAPQFGVPYTVRGMAASYSGVAVSGARVHYTVTRSPMWSRWYRFGYYAASADVVEGDTVTAADGSFLITFVPLPDSNVDLGRKPCFLYTVNVDVTDINGESHPAATTLRVGYRNAFLYLEDDAEEVLTLDGLTYKYVDINGRPLPTDKVKMNIALLRQPATPLLDAPAKAKGTKHTMSEAEFRKAFPMYAYGEDYNDKDTWPARGDSEKVQGSWTSQAAKPGARFKVQGESGVYRITLSAPGADTVVAYRYVTAPDARKVQSQHLLWSDVDRTTAEVGDTVTVRFGSRFHDVEVYYTMNVGARQHTMRRFRVSDELRSICIVVDSTMLGGFTLNLFSIREGVVASASYSVDVPFSHKSLDVDVATFRDRLKPGQQEQWTVRVKSGKAKAESATLVMTMYDDALNSYGSTPWDFSPWRRNMAFGIETGGKSHATGYFLQTYDYKGYNGDHATIWRLNTLSGYYYRGYGKVTMQGNMRRQYKSSRADLVSMEDAEDAVPVIEVAAAQNAARLSSDDIQRMPGNSVDAIVAAVGGIGYSDAIATADAEESFEDEALIPAPDAGVQMRTNLGTLAFFVAGLRTDDSGTATYSFTVPELLTRWNVRGLAVTKDIKIGTLDRTLVTSKRLMVQPNMPRFLRSGDSLGLMAKVVMSEELMKKKNEELPVDVVFLLTDAATGDTICYHMERVMVRDAAQVMFDVEVPQDVYVATYEVTAVAGGMSDGERGQLPVVSNRQAVTVSQAMYMSGVGEKLYRMPELLRGDDSRTPMVVAAEVTDNPVWLAVKCMPFLCQQESPSTIYLANQYYVNTLGSGVLDNLKDLKSFVALKAFKDTTSRLRMNEDVKQTLLQATPWVQDAQSEEEQMAAVASFFDSASLSANLELCIKQLQQRQNADGGWSWLPEGQSSTWTTQQVLKRVTSERFDTEAALAYIDREHQRYYDRYIKANLAKRWLGAATDIDYLYTRSLYGKGKTEAYKYYYSNALKHYKDYNDLYTQVQLALIFHRHGDRKQALDLLHRIEEKSLESDEMGRYWRDNRSGWFWYQRPIETQALLIRAYAEIKPADTVAIGQMQQWLLMQKRTSRWDNDRSTTEAIAALMVNVGSPMNPSIPDTLGTRNTPTSLIVFGSPLATEASGPEGYRSQRWTDDALDTMRAAGSDVIVFSKRTKGVAWGTVYYQFADDMDKLPASEMGITLKRTYVADGPLKVGDRVKVSIEIACDRAMEYLELVDGRPSCFEPLSTRAGWRWSNGLGYYVTVNNTDTRCYVEHIDKGKYVFEYEVYVTNPGTFMAGPVTMQCMYAPEFRAVSPAQGITVE